MRERISGLDNRIKSSPHIKSTSPDDVAQAPQVTNGAGAHPSCLLVPLVDALPEKMGESREASLWKPAEDLRNLGACSPFSSCLPGRYGEKKKTRCYHLCPAIKAEILMFWWQAAIWLSQKRKLEHWRVKGWLAGTVSIIYCGIAYCPKMSGLKQWSFITSSGFYGSGIWEQLGWALLAWSPLCGF